jgi:hypothetical protein
MQLVDGVEVNYDKLPVSHTETVRRYIEHGIEPGSGWTLILSADLRAVVAVDDDTREILPVLYRWLVNYAPSECWGSREKVREWIRARRAERLSGAGADDLSMGDHERDCGRHGR